MVEKYIRVFQKIDINDLKEHTLIFGDLSGSCSKCKEINLKIDVLNCPKCGVNFDYIAFRNIRNHLPKIQRLNESRPNAKMVDYDDFKKMVGATKAEDLFK